MPFAPRIARTVRRRRRSSIAARPLEALENRALLTTATVSVALAPIAGHHGAATRPALAHHLATGTGHSVAAAAHAAPTTHHAATAATRVHPSFTLTDFRTTHGGHQATEVGSRVSVGGHQAHRKLAADLADGDSTVASPQVTYAPVVGAYTPTQLRTAYGINALGIANQGQGMTIGIVDEFDDPNITGDANVFSAQYNLPQFNAAGGPTLTVYKDQALGTVTSAVGTGVGGETSLDVEWAHAMAPLANILLVEVPASGSVTNQFAQLLHGVQFAAQQGAAAVSLSYGYPERYFSRTNLTNQNNTYLATGAATSTVVTVSTGDYSTPLYPATSPNVVGVGGSSLYLASAKGRYSFETAWGGLRDAGSGGGGTSTYFASPLYQSANGVSYTNRAIPDVSMLADPVTGVSTYDSLDVTTSAPDPWGETGGTSLAAPLFAGMVTLAQQNRVAAGKALLTSAQLNTEIYTLYTSPLYTTYFHDITLGNNNDVYTNSGGTVSTTSGYAAGSGYDLATGVGSPIGNTLVPLLATL